MTRPFRTIAMCVLGGAALNVVVACACAIWSTVHGVPSEPPILELPYRHVDRAFHGFGVRIELVYSNWLHTVHLNVSSGWPLPALARNSWNAREVSLEPDLDLRVYTEVVDFLNSLPAGRDPDPLLAEFFASSPSRQEAAEFIAALHTAVTTATHQAEATPRRVLPLTPIWFGFSLNALAYAAFLWLLAPGPFALRRLLRHRRGLCPACAFPVGCSPTCTECGASLPLRAGA